MPELIYCCACMIYHSMLFLWAYKKLFRLKSRRNKRSEPYYYPFVMESVERRKSYNPIQRNTTRYLQRFHQVFRKIAKQRNTNCGDEGSPAHFSSVNMYFIYDILQNSNTGLKRIQFQSSWYSKNQFLLSKKYSSWCPNNSSLMSEKNNRVCQKKQFLVSKKSYVKKIFVEYQKKYFQGLKNAIWAEKS